MNSFKTIINPPYFLWMVLAIPWLLMTGRYISGMIYYGEFIHITGEFSARLLIISMALTPLRLMFSDKKWTVWLIARRRYFGVAAFAYALPHLIAYLIKLGSFANIIEEGFEPGILTAWIAFFIFTGLAITSNNFSIRLLGNNWKFLHRFVYLCAILTFAHWILVAFNPIPGYIHAGVLMFLEGYRIWKMYKKKSSDQTTI
jgi:sulfoxide reductase heme-binding subunit YedZ